ncbi:hypothetical protein AUTU_12660 [Aureibacter tunicatorum]|nr:hypothetical protein AUTU_12660 [Aureibacter tunicatorum]
MMNYAQAQDINFSGYDKTIGRVNPSAIVSNYAYINAQYRYTGIKADNQLHTYAVSGAYPIRLRRRRLFGTLGFYVLNDQNIGNGKLQKTETEFTFASGYTLSKYSYIATGLNLGYHFQSIDINQYTTGSQYYHGEGFINPRMDVNFDQNDQASYMNLSFGANYTIVDKQYEVKKQFGFSVIHFNQPNMNWSGYNYQFNPIYRFHGLYRVIDKKDWNLSPTYLLSYQNKEMIYTFGTKAKYNLKNFDFTRRKKRAWLEMDLNYRVNREVFLRAGVQFDDLFFGIGHGQPLDQSRNIVSGVTEVHFGYRKFIRKLYYKKKRKKKKKTYTNTIKKTTSYNAEKFDHDKKLPESDVKTESNQVSSVDVEETLNEVTNTEEHVVEEKIPFRKDIQFKIGTAALSQKEVQELKASIDELIDVIVRIEIIGHTDNTGSEPFNYQLGLKRANSVRNQLIDSGIDGSLIEVISKGESSPKFDNNTFEGRIRNRRAELIIYIR